MKTNKLRFSLCLLAFALILFTTTPVNSSQAQSIPKDDTPKSGSKKLLYTLPLQPKKESRMMVSNFQISYYDDGSVELYSESDYSAYSAPYAYQFEVDTSNATYSSSPISPEEDMPTDEDAAYNTPPEYNPGGGGGGEGEGGEDPMAGERPQYIVSSWWGRVRVQTGIVQVHR
ncbi:MAG TPA: hypothetical protein VNI02_21695 [Blastocatellia bacterium]|jgi:hypothetical protein|nr:hypothetical protein [Blastocatellia bacterium]